MNKLPKELAKIAVISTVSIIGYTMVKPKITVSDTIPKQDRKICMDYSKNQISQMPINLIRMMTNSYRLNQLAASENANKMEDAQSVWFDFETLKEYLYHIESISKRTDNVDSERLGIRIYYSTYPDDSLWVQRPFNNYFSEMLTDPEGQKYGNLHTVIMIPTIKRPIVHGYGNFDFNPLDDKTYRESMTTIEKYNKPSIPTVALEFRPDFGAENPKGTSARNHGGLIPPKKPADGELAF